MMSDSVRRVGGVAAMVLGLTYVAVGVAFFLQPDEQGPGGNLDEFFRSIADGAGWFLALNWAFVIGGVVALAVIPAATGIVLRGNEGWAIWAASLVLDGRNLESSLLGGVACRSTSFMARTRLKA